jgi:hypothetical protein
MNATPEEVVSQIEDAIAANRMDAASVFTQMRQMIQQQAAEIERLKGMVDAAQKATAIECVAACIAEAGEPAGYDCGYTYEGCMNSAKAIRARFNLED